LNAYQIKPKRYLVNLTKDESFSLGDYSYCSGFELQKWRCEGLANHLIEWIADYAMIEEELHVNHGNMYVRLREAAARIYSSDNYKKRGELGEVALHAICRDFFDTIPIAPRVFYLSSSNDVIKSFDLVHVRYVQSEPNFELWLGESKLYSDASQAISDAIASVKTHIDQGFLNHEKLILAPQISRGIPHYDAIRDLLSTQTSLDQLFKTAVFPVCIMANSTTTATMTSHSDEYKAAISRELGQLRNKLISSGLTMTIKIILIYVPLASKDDLTASFDAKLKGLSA
jgi:hypothetical protein